MDGLSIELGWMWIGLGFGLRRLCGVSATGVELPGANLVIQYPAPGWVNIKNE